MPSGLARLALVSALLAAIAALVPAGAAARTTVAPAVTTTDGVTRLTVTITTSGRFSTRTRPRSVTVKHGRKTYRLRAARSRAARASSVWRSSAYRGSRGRAVARLARKRVTVQVKTRARTQSFRRRVARTPGSPQPGPTPGPGPSPDPPPGSGTPAPGNPPLFEAPPSQLEGQAAAEHIRRYFVDSRFTDCPAGWPACAVEERYNHCADGSWEYRRFTPSSGSDINSFGTYQVTGAVARTDGSWGVEYFANEDRTQFYSWNVAADGVVTGNYFFDGQFSQTLGPLAWQQPAGC